MKIVKPICNICKCETFSDFRGRQKVLCTNCQSLERHRICHKIYEQEIRKSSIKPRVLHIAPEQCFQFFFSESNNFHYLSADANPSIYSEWASPLKLFLPRDLSIFTDGYFDYIIHNHILEHLPGDWKEHLIEFIRCLASGGKMIFTVPGPIKPGSKTIDGGEYFKTDEERIKLFHQKDHFKQFGSDLFEYLHNLSEIKFNDALSISNEDAKRYKAGERVMMVTKN